MIHELSWAIGLFEGEGCIDTVHALRENKRPIGFAPWPEDPKPKKKRKRKAS